MAVPRKSSNRNTISAMNVGCETPTKALSSKVVARKVLAIATAHTIQFLKVAIAIVRSSQRQHTAPSCASLYAPDNLNILQFAFLCNGSSILLTMTNGIEGVASEVISNYLPRSGLKSPPRSTDTPCSPRIATVAARELRRSHLRRTL